MTDFYDRIKEYLSRYPNDVVVIESHPIDPSLRSSQLTIRNEWFAYLDRKGLKHTRKVWELILRGYGKALTLPCANPADFDREYAREFSPRNRHWDK